MTGRIMDQLSSSPRRESGKGRKGRSLLVCRICACAGMTLVLLTSANARAADSTGAVVNLTIENHKFTPAQVAVPAGQPATITINNLDPLAEEFDSSDLHIEKVVAGKSSGTVHLHPLDAGTYKFMGEYHSDTAQGVVVAK